MSIQTDWPNTYKYMLKFGYKVVGAIRSKIRKYDLIQTGDLLAGIDFEILQKGKSFGLVFTIDEVEFGKFQKSNPAKPEEYGVYVNYTKKGKHYFTATVDELTRREFEENIDVPLQKDIELQLQKELKKIKK